MHDLQLLGVHDDGEHVVFVGADGQRYRAAVDDALRAAVRRDRARLNQLQISGQSLRPRDIQNLVRAGRSAEQIADEAGMPLEFVQRFEGPVLAERENIVWRARQTRVRRRDEVGPTLGDLVDERLEARGVSLTRNADWDAWREEDGTWTVQVAFTAGGQDRIAQWRFDVGASHLTAADDESKWLTSEHGGEQGRRPARADRQEAAAAHEGALDRILRRRLETVEIRSPWTREESRSPTPDVGDNGPTAGDGPHDGAAQTVQSRPEPAGHGAAARPEQAAGPTTPPEDGSIGTVPEPGRDTAAEAGRPPLEQESDRADSADQPEAVAARRDAEAGARTPSAETTPTKAAPDEVARDESAGDADEPARCEPTETVDDSDRSAEDEPAPVATPAAALPPAAHPADSHPEDLPDATVVQPGAAEPEPAPKPAPKPTPTKPKPTRRQTATRKNRASVPSWDDILFGSKKD